MQLDSQELRKIVQNALDEDIGKGDITSNLTIPADVSTAMMFNAREDMVVCGIPVVKQAITLVDSNVTIDLLVSEGDFVKSGSNLIKISGKARSILAAERVALNFFQHMSAMATLAHRYAQAVKGTNAVILDTRKTLPGLRLLAKYAVKIGGCKNHRFRLDDGILIKDNHIHVAGGIKQALEAVQKGNNQGLKIEIECDTLEQVAEAIAAKADIIMLDNMSCHTMKKAVSMAAEVGENRPLLEASGGVNLNTVREIAQTGVDYISVGALTHSAGNADIGLDSL